MADNVTLNTGSGGATLRSVSDAGGIEWPVSVVVYATSTTPGAGTFQFVGTSNGMPVIVESGSITVNAGTNLNTSALALETGGNLATIAGIVTANKAAVLATQTGTWNVTVNTALPAGTNVLGHVIVDSGTITTVSAVTAITNPLPAGTNVIGHVIVDSGTLTTVTTVSAVTAITNALPAGTNSIGTVQVGNTPNTTPILANHKDPAATTGNITVVDSGTSSTTGQNGQTIITGAPTASSSVSCTFTGHTSYTIQIVGTWTGTISFERSIDGGTTWVPTSITLYGSTTPGTTYAGSLSSVTLNCIGHGNVGGDTQIRARATATMTGTANVTIQPGFGVGLVAVGQTATNSVYAAMLASTPLYAKISTSSSGPQTIVAAVSGKQIIILCWSLSSNGTVNVNWQSHTTTGTATGLHYMTQFATAGGAFCPVGIFATVAGEALDLNLSGSVAVGGELTYIVV